MNNINTVERLGQLVRDERKKQGLTQETLSAYAGVGVRFLRELEQGKQTCQIGKVLTVLSMLGLSLNITDRRVSS